MDQEAAYGFWPVIGISGHEASRYTGYGCCGRARLAEGSQQHARTIVGRKQVEFGEGFACLLSLVVGQAEIASFKDQVGLS